MKKCIADFRNIIINCYRI